MSRYIGGGFKDPEIDSIETIFSKEDILQEQINNFLLEEEALIEKIREIDKAVN